MNAISRDSADLRDLVRRNGETADPRAELRQTPRASVIARRRDASARCPELIVLDRNAASEIRTFESVLSAIEEISAGVAPVRPGLCALRVPSRFYGGEKEAAAVVAEHLVG